MPPIDRADRIAGGMFGLLVGDALGVPYEFHRPEALPPAHQIEMEPPAGFRRSHEGIPPGSWSDDGAQALALLDSLLECGRLDLEDIGRRFLAWARRGEYAVEGRVFDIGLTTQQALNALQAGIAAELAGPAHEYANGNGSLMRSLPLALWHRGTDAELVADACTQSRLSHGHARSQACCAAYCLWARRVLDDAPDPWRAAVSALRGLCEYDSPIMREFEGAIRPDEPGRGRGSGYVVDCLNSARFAIDRGRGFEAVARIAVSLGHDTDTTACVACGIAGLRYGLSSIPPRWLEALRGGEISRPIVARLLARMCP
jgi:ADP-ribosylglycohydrolase